MSNIDATTLPDQLPTLRTDLEIQTAGYDINDLPLWTLHDPNTQHFFDLGYLEYQIIARWHLVNPQAIITAVNTETSLEIDNDDISLVYLFLQQHCLLKQSHNSLNKAHQQSKQYKTKHPWLWLAKNYLFIRIPLFHPDKFLERTSSKVQWLFSSNISIVIGIIGLIAILMTIQNYEQYFSTLPQFFTHWGIVLFIIVLIASKIIHELAHAYRAKSYGLKVSSIGVAFLVFWPVLYTDTTESWKLSNKYQRLKIGFAGIQSELYLAAIALFLWHFMPIGVLKTLCFYVATINIVTSLIINLNPFLRFDGYHMLSDIWGVRNLQTRSFALAKWWIRKILLGFTNQCPEVLPNKQRRLFIVYAITTWLYRLILLLAIALLVYHFFFKALGIILLIFEVALFICYPIVSELKIWWQQRSKIQWNIRTYIVSACMICLLAFILVPWQTSLRIPATLSVQAQQLYAPADAKIKHKYIKDGMQVKSGTLLAELESPSLTIDIAKAKLEVITLQTELQKYQLSRELREDHQIVRNKLQQARQTLSALQKQAVKLKIHAPMPGTVLQISSQVANNNWVAKGQYLFAIKQVNQLQIEALMPGDYLEELNTGMQAEFIPDNHQHPIIDATLTTIATKPLTKLVNTKEMRLDKQQSTDKKIVATIAYHVGDFGGSIATREDSDGQLIPEKSYYRLLLTPSETYSVKRVETGKLVLPIWKAPLLVEAWRKAVTVIHQELNF